ncbi:gliding motility-associated ABC transporter substrate-binding protein GldG [Phaeodactylibacter luteus]|uniref:Gliding motility-associated ABC transporter substrate-binding protein GldG n=1 Tax=Phaeodactylibacter luteus TaxID=1564516 RepID=A0A5C6RKL6_9BACT|nr:gliding motility-associated ABC transporter substrate-binding protein GldG [Phaeodactylibacter luteus]TXB62777.1 gliding motility-associated ABC transporter substrate-binding protein GldG [Phaeodactylibacter luteus]
MAKRKKGNRQSDKAQFLVQMGLFIGILFFVNILANARIGGKALYTYLDMTEEKRFTLTPATADMLEQLDDVVFIRVLLEGEFPAGFKRLQSAAQDVLDDFRGVSGFVEYEFENPNDGTVDEINERRKILREQGIVPTQLTVKGVEGTERKMIYPYAIVYYKNRNIAVNLLENEVPGMPQEVTLNNSVGLLEYKLANAISRLQTTRKPNVLFTEGHGELRPIETADLQKDLLNYYEIGRVNLDSVVAIGEDCSVLIVAKPTQPFSERDKFKIDQYVMNGGKVVWLLDKVRVDLDSLQGRSKYYPNEYDLNLDDLLFRYGIRIQPNLVLDMQSSSVPLVVGMQGNAPQFDNFRYPYHPVIAPQGQHPIVKNMGLINLKYPSTIDLDVTVKTEVEKIPLLQSSRNTRVQFIPVEMNFEFLRYDLEPDKFNQEPQTLGLLLEGQFPSLYQNRVTEAMLGGLRELGMEYKAESLPTKMVVISDGDLARNKVARDGQSYSPLGYNEFDKYLFANKDLLSNVLEYLVDENGVIQARGKEVKLRLLDSVRARDEKSWWQLFNIGLPLVFLGIFGLIYNGLRRRRFARAA